jgi:hypothetical protein
LTYGSLPFVFIFRQKLKEKNVKKGKSMNFKKGFTPLVLLALLISFLSNLHLVQAAYSITLIYPNGGELLMGGSEYDIEWTTSNPGYGYVTLLYSLDNGASWIKIDNVPNTLVIGGNPSYTWTVPSVRSTHCRIKLNWHSGGTYPTLYATDTSDNEFTISPVQIYFCSEGDVKVMLAGGVGEVNLTKSPENWEYQPSASADGELIAFVRMEEDSSGNPMENTSEIWLMNSEGGNQTKITTNNIVDVEPAISPDSAPLAWKIVFTRFDATGSFSNLYLAELTPGGYDPITHNWIPPHISETQLTSGAHQDREPRFSPDGTEVVFSSNRGGDKFQLYTIDLSNPATVNRALPGMPPYTTMDQRTPDWSPDGKWFACSMESETQSDIYIADSWGPINTRRVFQLTSTPEPETPPSWSPDSREMAFIRGRTIPDAIIQELWTMKLKIENRAYVVENKLLIGDLGSRIPMGAWGHRSRYWTGYPSWRCLEGLRILDVELEGRVDNAFMARLEVFGGARPYTWSLLGTLPSGLSFSQGAKYPIDLSSMAVIQGTPTQAMREHTFEVKVVDNSGVWTQRSFTISIRPKRDLELVTTGRFLPPAVEGERYEASVQFVGGLAPYYTGVESAIYGKELPEGLSWQSRVSGDTLTVWLYSPDNGLPSGRYRVKVQVFDSFGDVKAGFFDLNVLRMEWNVRDVFGDNFDIYAWGLPEEVGMERFITGVSVEAGGIEVNIPISSVSPSGDHHNITAPYPDFSPWSSLFTPGQSTIIGKLKVKVNLEGNEATATIDFPIHRYMFRKNRGFSFPNFSGQISFDDFAEFFGWDETTFWTPWGRVPRLIPGILSSIPIGRGGNCTGMSVSAYDIADDIARTMWTDHPNLPHALDKYDGLAKPEGEVLSTYIMKRQWWILSIQFIRLFSTVIPAHSNWDRWSNKMLEDIGGYGLPCYIVMFKDHTGNAHTVTAYAMEDLPDGRKLIRVYDSNKPFRYTETSDNNSAIYVDPARNNSWTYTMANGELWGNDWILAIPIGLLRGDPDLPGLEDLPELIFDWTFFALIGSAGPTQVTDNEGHPSFTAEGELNIDPATGMPYCLPIPLPAQGTNSSVRLFYAPPRPHKLDISGMESGKYDFLYMPMDGMLMNFSVDTSEGSKDNITFNPQQLSTTFSTQDSKKFGYKMAREFENERRARMFILDNIQTHSGNITFSTTPEGDAIIVRNDGASTSYDLRVEYLAENEEPQAFGHENISLGSGETQRITSTSWEVLNTAGVNVEIDKGSDGTWDENMKLGPTEKPPEAWGLGPGVIIVAALAVAVVIGLSVFLRKRRTTGATQEVGQ